MAEQTITAEKLCALTGLTDRRHRQLAKSGYFPPPIMGEYQLHPVIIGMFKYYKEQLNKKDDTLARERQQYMRARREKAEIETSILKGEYIPADEIEAVLRNLSLHQKAVLQVKLETELPPKVSGLGAVDIGIKMREIVDELCRIMREGVAKWVKEPPKA